MSDRPKLTESGGPHPGRFDASSLRHPVSFALPLTGRRRPDQFDGDLPVDLRFGDYWRTNGIWAVYIPGGPVGTLPNHYVEVHDDGTITVEPGGGGISNSIPGHRFHGWIRRGVWSES